jgi:hypothetical protein
MQFSTTKRMHHMHPRCGLVGNKPAVGKDKEEWTPKRQTGSTGISGSLFLLHHWYVTLLPRKISTDKDEQSRNVLEQSKKYYADKYNAEMETEPVHCPMGQDLVKYLANRERNRVRSKSNPLRQRHNLEWCPQREDLDQEYIHNVLRTGLLKEGGGDGFPFTASTAVGIKNIHVMLSGKPLTFYLVVMLLTFIIGQGMDGTSMYRGLLVQHC